MNIQTITREDLLKEFQKLQQENNALKVSHNDIIENFKKSEENLIEYNNTLLKLNDFSIELSKLSSDENLGKFIVKNLKEIAGATAAVYNEYNAENKTLVTKHIEINASILEKVVNILGYQVKKFQTPINDEFYKEITSKVVGTKNTLTEVTAGVIPSFIGETIQKLMNVDRFIGVAFLVEGRLYGTALLAMKKNVPDPSEQILTNFAFLAAMALRRKEAEGKLVLAEESERLKSAFLANMSHEIRTPMNGILGFASLLKHRNLTGEKQQIYLDVIEKSGRRLLNIINDIIDISKIESGMMTIHLSETNINEQISYMFTFFKPEVENKGLEFIISNNLPEKKANIKTDKEKVYAILTNLVKNAIKFTKHGSIEICCTIKGKHLEFFVKDSGEGIRPEYREIIFERFRQVDESYTRSTEGAGLGLSISKAYVEMLGGEIWVESEEDEGSTFFFTIPHNSEPEEKKSVKKIQLANKQTTQGKKLKILIAEDDKISDDFFTIAMETFSNTILKAKNGAEAVKICRNNPDIDLILMDIQMPLLNGYEATSQIRQFNSKVVIIAQTAYALINDKEKAIDAGCNDYISKPIDISELEKLIQKHIQKLNMPLKN